MIGCSSTVPAEEAAQDNGILAVFAAYATAIEEPWDGVIHTALNKEPTVQYSTLSPCDMCSGTVLLYKIPKVIIGENQTFQGPEDYVHSCGVELEILNDAECMQLMEDFIAAKPELWNEDIGV